MICIRSSGSSLTPSFSHSTSGIGLPIIGAEKESGKPSSVYVSRRSLINAGFSSGESFLVLAEIRNIIAHNNLLNIKYYFLNCF